MADEETLTGTEASHDGDAESPKPAGGLTPLRQQAEATFKALDSDEDGFVTRDELRTSYKSLGLDLPEAAIDQLMSADTNGDGRIDLEEWLRSVDQAQPEPAPAPEPSALD
ncbi:EF-hand domain-containing protein [Spirillospora sp. NPDC052269]